jgi:hypothetical protein
MKTEIKEKWDSVLTKYGIGSENFEKVSNYLTMLPINIDVQNKVNGSFNIEDNELIPLNLSIISKIWELNRVKFISAPIFTVKSYEKNESENENTFIRKDKFDQVDELKTIIKIPKELEIVSTTDDILNDITDIIAENINKKINEGYTIYVYMLLSNIIETENEKIKETKVVNGKTFAKISGNSELNFIATSRMKFIK